MPCACDDVDCQDGTWHGSLWGRLVRGTLWVRRIGKSARRRKSYVCGLHGGLVKARYGDSQSASGLTVCPRRPVLTTAFPENVQAPEWIKRVRFHAESCAAGADSSAAGDGRSPFVGAHIPKMLREEPAVTLQVLDCILPFAVGFRGGLPRSWLPRISFSRNAHPHCRRTPSATGFGVQSAPGWRRPIA
jgi:hypothetical protein